MDSHKRVLVTFSDRYFVSLNFETKWEFFMNSANVPKVRHGSLKCWLGDICKSPRCMIALLYQKEQHYRNRIKKIITDELNAVLLDLIPAKRKAMALDAMIPDLLGISTLAVGNVNSCLCIRRNEAMAKAMRTLTEKKIASSDVWSSRLKLNSWCMASIVEDHRKYNRMPEWDDKHTLLTSVHVELSG